MAKINLLRKSSTYDPKAASYRMRLEIISTEDIPKYVFVKQRLLNSIQKHFDDVFAAISTPAQLEDFDTNSPREGSSFFRSDYIDLVSRNADYLEEVFNSILIELQKLVKDYESLNILTADGIYEITAKKIDINMADLHTHYRLPLVASPAGTNETFNSSGTKHRVGNENYSLPGWVNTTKVGYKFKYNISQDTTLKKLWPPTESKISYAHLEVNGVTKSAVLIANDTIYWDSNLPNNLPWPTDYVDEDDRGADNVTLILDFIV